MEPEMDGDGRPKNFNASRQVVSLQKDDDGYHYATLDNGDTHQVNNVHVEFEEGMEGLRGAETKVYVMDMESDGQQIRWWEVNWEEIFRVDGAYELCMAMHDQMKEYRAQKRAEKASDKQGPPPASEMLRTQLTIAPNFFSELTKL